jgi:hypothetical protein
VRSLLRSWRIWWLALALVAAPQLSFVHAMSHHAPAAASAEAGDEHPPASDPFCATCLSLAHLGNALATGHAWASAAPPATAPHAPHAWPAAQPAAMHFQARAPPRFL